MRQLKQEPKQEKQPDVVISLAELVNRRRAWGDYYERVRGTKAYKRFLLQREALDIGDFSRVKELSKEAGIQITNNSFELAQPVSKDPDIELRYKRLGVYEWMKNKNEDAQKIEEVFGND